MFAALVPGRGLSWGKFTTELDFQTPRVCVKTPHTKDSYPRQITGSYKLKLVQCPDHVQSDNVASQTASYHNGILVARHGTQVNRAVHHDTESQVGRTCCKNAGHQITTSIPHIMGTEFQTGGQTSQDIWAYSSGPFEDGRIAHRV